MVSGSWGTWRDEVRSAEVLDLPLRLLSASDPATRRITAAVDALRAAGEPPPELWSPDSGSGRSAAPVLRTLDDAVADLFELNRAERDLVADFWANQRGDADEPVPQQVRHWGTAEDISADGDGLHRYLKVFLEGWNPRLGGDGELSWRIWRDERARVITVVFEPQERGRRRGSSEPEGSESWTAVLKRLGASLRKQRAGMLPVLRHGSRRLRHRNHHCEARRATFVDGERRTRGRRRDNHPGYGARARVSNRIRLSSLGLCAAHEQLCLELLRSALALLASDGGGESESDLNRGLYRAIIRASHATAAAGDAPPVVVPEGRNPPAASDRERAEREFKVPDFYWAHIDDLVPDPEDAAKQFVVECKRLTVRSKSWIYTEQYVKSGIARFIKRRHGYGMGAASGAMVGYVQHIKLDDALAEVNTYARADSIPPLSLNTRSGNDGAELDHRFNRSFAESPFHLLHLWVRV
jgi:hypothetical protein